jgi:glycerol-1-phosphate dehydrogenase [NAD(P)+]
VEPSTHLMELPRRILIGDGVLSELGDFIEVPERAKIVVASGENVQERVHKRVTASVAHSIRWVNVNSSDMANVNAVARAAAGADCIIGLGGGKSVDVGKLAATRGGLPFFSVPTSASHDGISSPFASIRGTKKHYSMKAKPPVGILADVEVISAAPKRLLAAGCGDLVSKLTAVKDWQLAHDTTGEYYGGYAASLAMMSARLVLDGSKRIGAYDLGAVRELVEGLISAGVAAGIAGSSRPCSGSEHLFSHALEVICPGKGLHGEKCGIGTIMMAKLHGLPWEGVRRALKDVEAPTSASEIAMSDEEVVRALTGAAAIRPDRFTILSKMKLDTAKARRLARETEVI